MVAEIQIRPATLADLGFMAQLERSAFAGEAWTPEALGEALANEDMYFCVAEVFIGVTRKPIFAGYAGLFAARSSSDADVLTLATVLEMRKNGIGRKMLQALIDQAAERHVKQLFLEVRESNQAAQKLYLSEGFAQIGTRKRYYPPATGQSDFEDAVIMLRKLN